jgi:hypothetical protein
MGSTGMISTESPGKMLKWGFGERIPGRSPGAGLAAEEDSEIGVVRAHEEVSFRFGGSGRLPGLIQ